MTPDDLTLASDDAPAGHASLILLADGDQHRRDIYSSMLREAGFEVAAAGDEATALAAARRAPSAIVLTHFTATSVGDLSLCRQLRSTGSTRNVPVIVLTGVDDEFTRSQIVRAGATAILVEPLKQGILVRRVRRLITHTGRRRRPA
jgi:PleD family two-component response regulator